MSIYNYCGPIGLIGMIEHGIKDVFTYDGFSLPFTKYGNIEGVSIVTFSKAQDNKERYEDSIEAQRYRKEFIENWSGIGRK